MNVYGAYGGLSFLVTLKQRNLAWFGRVIQ